MLRPLALVFSYALALSAAPALDVWHAKPDIRTVEPTTALKLTGLHQGDLYRPRLTDTGKTPVHVTEVHSSASRTVSLMPRRSTARASRCSPKPRAPSASPLTLRTTN